MKNRRSWLHYWKKNNSVSISSKFWVCEAYHHKSITKRTIEIVLDPANEYPEKLPLKPGCCILTLDSMLLIPNSKTRLDNKLWPTWQLRYWRVNSVFWQIANDGVYNWKAFLILLLNIPVSPQHSLKEYSILTWGGLSLRGYVIVCSLKKKLRVKLEIILKCSNRSKI
jgi:hypothetical protein